jgi:hypothetical protein
LLATGNWNTPCARPAMVSALMSRLRNPKMVKMLLIGSFDSPFGPPRPISPATLKAPVRIDIRLLSSSASVGMSGRSVESQRVTVL